MLYASLPAIRMKSCAAPSGGSLRIVYAAQWLSWERVTEKGS